MLSCPKIQRSWKKTNWKAEGLSSRRPQRKYCHYWDSFLCPVRLPFPSIVFSHVIALITAGETVKIPVKEDVSMSVQMHALRVVKEIVVEVATALVRGPVKMPVMNHVKAT